MAYNFLDNAVVQKLYKHGLISPAFISVFSGTFRFTADFFTKFHTYKLMKSTFGFNSSFKNIFISWKQYCYESLFALNLGWLLYRDTKAINKKLSKTQIINLEAFLKAIDEDAPVILLTGHTGLYYNGFFSGFTFPQDKEIAMLVPKQFEENRKKIMESRIRSHHLINENSTGSFQTVDIQDKYNLAKILGVFKRKGIIISTCDFAFSFTKNTVIRFFNRHKEVPVGIYEMGLKFHANIVPVFNYRYKGKYFLEFGDAIKLEKSQNSSQDGSKYAAVMLGLLESRVFRFPDKYTLWKTLFFKSSRVEGPLKSVDLANKRYVFIHHGGLYFNKGFKKNQLDNEWLLKIKSHLPQSFNLISKYLDIHHYPGVFFFNKESRESVIGDLSLAPWTKAFSFDRNMFILFDKSESRWDEIINHEMFHCGVNQFFEGKKLIPNWFNESISFYIGNNFNVDKQALCNYMSMNFENTVDLLINDALIQDCEYAFDIIKSFGYFFCKTYSPDIIKNILVKTKEYESFEKGLSDVLGVCAIDLINSWYDNLIHQSDVNKKGEIEIVYN